VIPIDLPEIAERPVPQCFHRARDRRWGNLADRR